MKLPPWPAALDRQPAPSPLYTKLAKQVALAVVLWVAHFLHSAQFGLYEDDWNRVPRIVGVDWHALWGMIAPVMVTVSGQGRPLHTAFILFFSFLGFNLAQFQGIYVVAFLLLFAATLLFQSFLIKVFRDERFAFLGALAFTVYLLTRRCSLLRMLLGCKRR